MLNYDKNWMKIKQWCSKNNSIFLKNMEGSLNCLCTKILSTIFGG
jgi:hypothetical protein